MPERQIAWRKVAAEVEGALRVETTLRSTRLRIAGTFSGMRLQLDGESNPYSLFGGSTLLRVRAIRPLNATLSLYRNTGQVPLYQRFVRRDVIIGDSEFDRDWIINAARQAQAQAFLCPELRALLRAIPGAKANETFQESGQATSCYDFHVRGREARARAKDFETDANRMMAAIEAATMLVQSPERLLNDYRRLARELGGELTETDDWSMDGRIVVRFAAHGRAMTVSPISVQTGWRQDRLRTRVACEMGSKASRASQVISRSTDLTSLVRDVGPVRQAMEASQMVGAHLTPILAWVDLDGHATDLVRLRAAAFLAASLSRGKRGELGPYR